MRFVRQRPVVDRQADAHREHAEDDPVNLGVVDLREAACRAEDLREADRAEREDAGEHRPVNVIVEPSFQHVSSSR